MAYWLDGALRCGHLLGDTELVARARAQLDYVMARQQADGYLGPRHLKTGEANSLWPHAVLMRAFMAEYSATGDGKVLCAMRQFADFFVAHMAKGGTPRVLGTADVFSLGERDLFNIENVLHTADRARDPSLADRAMAAFRSVVTLEKLAPGGVPSGHAISCIERLKLPILVYLQTGESAWLEAVRNEFRALDEHHMLIDGLPSSCEELSGRQSNAVHETCLASDYTWTVGYMLLATGEAEWADRIERACFNAGLGSVTKDFRSHQYYSSPNQVIAAANTSHWNADLSWYGQSKARMAYQPGHDTECCTGNVNRFMPNYCARMWLRGPEGAVVAALYGPSVLTVEVGEQPQAVRITQLTDYPFGETVTLRIEAAAPVRFPLMLRIPGWCTTAELRVNSQRAQMRLDPGTFATLDRQFAPGDEVTLKLPMRVRVVPLPWDGIAVERGPLVFSYPVSSATTIRTLPAHSSPDFPAYEMCPDGCWQYALDLDVADAGRIAVITKPMAANPWRLETTPVRLHLPAVRLRHWDLEKGHTPVLPSPISSAQSEEVELVPMGATTLRLTVFPDCRHQFSRNAAQQ
jgi:DUF1680 family protein